VKTKLGSFKFGRHKLFIAAAMPFERYLRYDENAGAESDGFESYNNPHSVQFQIPQFMFNGPPTLAPGGGAEVLSNPGNIASSWFNNNGFSTEK
jgi:hypothetical protein